MGLSIEIVEFDMPIGGALTTVDITSAGFGTPKLAIFLSQNNDGSADTLSQNGKFMATCFGAYDGTRQRCNVNNNDDGHPKDQGTSYFDTGAIYRQHHFTTNYGRIKANNWITDGVQIEVINQLNSGYIGTSAPKCTCILINGTALASVKVNSFQISTTTLNHTGVGFEADTLLCFTNGRTTQNTAAGALGIWAVLNDGNESSYSGWMNSDYDASSASVQARMYNDGTLDGHWTQSSSSSRFSISDFDSTGFTLTQLAQVMNNCPIGYIAMKFTEGYSADVSGVTFPIAGNVSVSGMRVSPEFVYLISDTGVSAYNTWYSSGTYLQGFTHCVFNGSDIHSHSRRHDDAVGTMQLENMYSNSLRCRQGNGGDAYHSTSYSIEDSGFTFITTTSPAAEFLGFAFAIGKIRPTTKALLHLDGEIGAASVADADELDATSEDFTFELTGTASTLTETTTIISNTESATARSMRLDLVDDDLTLYLSSDGTTWDIASGLVVATITLSRFSFTMERITSEILYFLDGVEQGRIFTTAAIAAGGEWSLGFDADSTVKYSDMIIHAWRFMIGSYRYGVDHDATATPFADSGSYGAGVVYSANPALIWKDLAESTLYGLGATTVGVEESSDWCDEFLDDGLDPPTPRCRVGLTIASPSRVTYWMDIMGNYANCVWYPDGSDLRLSPDQSVTADNPSGLDVVYNGIFDTIP